MKKHFYWLGIIGSIFYVVGVIIGGMLIPHYSHINQAISEIDPLISGGNRIYITILFGGYNLLILLYGLLIFWLYKNRGKLNSIQALSIALMGALGLLMYYFPMDTVDSEITFKGIVHIVLAGIMAPLTILCTMLGYWTFKDNRAMRLYSLITSVVILIIGPISAYYAANNMAHGMGLLERITIGSFILWLFISGLYYKKLVSRN